MYKRRDIAIAELVANSWDANAKNVHITLPHTQIYNQQQSVIIIEDDGCGMSDHQVQEAYLVVGRNRRTDGEASLPNRKIMGRKGIGKLAGFGIASLMTIETWRNGFATSLTLDVNKLKLEDGISDNVSIPGTISPVSSELISNSGTRLTLKELKHATPIDVEKLVEALARRFSRTVFGEMKISINGVPVDEPKMELEYRYPQSGYETHVLPDGKSVKYYYAFARDVIKSAEMRGFTIHVHGKTAQAPPFFFGVEATASGQHGTKYLTGIIEADFLDDSIADNEDLISTDRQEIEWEDENLSTLKSWGESLTRQALRERSNKRGEVVEQKVLNDAAMRHRIERLDLYSKNQVSKFLRELGKSEADPERAADLADALVRVYEYRHFHDVATQIENVSDDPDQLYHLLYYLSDWKVLESRAILEIIKGRLNVIDKFHKMIVNDAPETTSKVSLDNMHDLLAGYPWLLNPEWQVLDEEKTISRQLREWNIEDIKEEDARLRYDFLALADESRLIVVELKRSGHPVRIDELHRLLTYRERLRKGHQNVHVLLVFGGVLDISEEYRRDVWDKMSYGEIRLWHELYERGLKYYEHYRDVLEGEVEGRHFSNKVTEVLKSRLVLGEGSTHRGQDERRQGLGPQDIDYTNLR